MDNSKIKLENNYKIKSYDGNLIELNKNNSNNSNQSKCINCKNPLNKTNLSLCKYCFKNEILNEVYSSYLDYLNTPNKKEDSINANITINDFNNEKKTLDLNNALILYNKYFPDKKFEKKEMILELKKKLCIACLNDIKTSSFCELPCKCNICCLTHLNDYLSFFRDFKGGFYCRCKKYYDNRMMRELILIKGLNKDIYERIKLYFQKKLDSICCICIKTEVIRDNSKSLISRDKPEYNQFLHSLKHYFCDNCLAVDKNKEFFCQICQMNHFYISSYFNNYFDK